MDINRVKNGRERERNKVRKSNFESGNEIRHRAVSSDARTFESGLLESDLTKLV